MKKLQVLLLGFLAIVAMLILTNWLFLIFSHNDDIAGIEQVFLYYIVEVLNGGVIYKDFNEIPFLNCQYTPLYFELFGNSLKIVFADSSQDQRTVYIILRAVNLFLNLASSTILAHLAWQMSGRSNYDFWLIGILTFLCFTNYHIAIRPDSLKSFFVIMVLSSFYHSIFEKSKQLISLTIFSVSALLAIYSKQDAAFIVMACIVAGMVYDDTCKWLKIGIIISVVAAITAFLLWLHYGDPLFKNLLLVLQFEYAKENLLTMILRWYSHWTFYVLLSLMFYFLVKLKYKSRASSILAFIAAIALPFTLMSSAKWGAGPNYYLDLLLISILLIFFTIKAIPDGQFKKLAYLAFVITGALMLFKDISKGVITMYNTDDEKRFKANWAHVSAIKEKVISASATEGFYLLTFEKGLCNSLPSSCLFPSYETDRPELLQSTFRYFKGITNLQMPNYPGLSLYQDTAFSAIVSERTVFAVYPKTFRFIDFYDFHESKFTLLDSTDAFYLYKMVHKAGER